MKTKRLLSVLALACLLPLSVLADVYQDPETKVNYAYWPESGVARVLAGTYSEAGSPEVSGDITILEKFTIDEQEYLVTGIGDYAFSGCTGLKELNFPESLHSIGFSAFYNCTGLGSVFIPKNVEYIDSNPFRGCSSLSNIVVDPNNPYFDSRSDCNAIIITDLNCIITGCKNTTIPEDQNITGIGNDAFEGSGLLSITIPNSVIEIKDYAFCNCEELASVTLPNSVTNIGSHAFYRCSNLSAITIPNSVTIINESAFESCHNLQNAFS